MLINKKTIISEQTIDDFAICGAVFLPELFLYWVDQIRSVINENIASPGPYAAENLQPQDTGRFFDDYCNWQRLPGLEDIVRFSPAACSAAQLMKSQTVKIFHDHVLVKEPGTSKATPWHQDAPYYFVDGSQTVSFWIPVDPVDKATLRFISGSHLWEQMIVPVKWLSEDNFYAENDAFLPAPDPDIEKDKYEILEWPMQPGDAVAFHYRTVHGARSNMTKDRRRALSLRYIGDDAHFVERPGRTSPPFKGHNMSAGDTLRNDWFPIVWPP